MLKKIIGNSSWTKVDNCDECGCESDVIVSFSSCTDAYSGLNLCKTCINKAAKLFEEVI